MKKTMIVLLTAVVAVVLLWHYRESQAQSETATEVPPARIGVVDVPKALTECKANADREAEGKHKREAIDTEIKKLDEELDQMQKELETALKPGTPEHDALLENWFKKNLWRQNYEKVQAELMSKDSVVWMQDLYSTMLEEIRLLALKRGLTLVIEKDAMQEPPDKLSDMYRMISSRKVLYNAPEMDLTEALIERLDLAYEQKKK